MMYLSDLNWLMVLPPAETIRKRDKELGQAVSNKNFRARYENYIAKNEERESAKA